MEHPDSPRRPRQRMRIDLQEEPDGEAAVLVAGDNTTVTTIHHLPDDVLGLSLELLGGIGHFRYCPLACKLFLKASEKNSHCKKITTGESVTSSVSCVQKYFEDVGTGKKQLEFFWTNAIRYGRVNVMQWAHQQNFMENTRILVTWMNPFRTGACTTAAKYGQLLTLQWLKANGYAWNFVTSIGAPHGGHPRILERARCDGTCEPFNIAAIHGHLNILQWLRENGCDWNENTCATAAKYGHLHILQWARENGCPWDITTCGQAAINGHYHILYWAFENGMP